MTRTASTGPLIDNQRLAAHLGDPEWIVFDCRFDLADPGKGERAYLGGHIPGAHYAHLDRDLSSPIGPGTGRHPLPDPKELCRRLVAWGVHRDSRVVVYDDLGGAFAVRLWWLLRWLGHTRVSLLDGGLQVWIDAGYALEEARPMPTTGDFSGAPNDGAWVGTAALEQALGSDRYLVVDARAPERYRGEVEPIDPVAGHIPGAVNMPLGGNLGTHGRFLSPETLRARFLAAIGDCPPERVVHHCGSGVNACHNLLAMELAELEGSKLYPGSWSEWIRDPRRPVATGAER